MPVESETSFKYAKQNVEKNEIDIFGTLLNHRKTSLDLYFVGPLQSFNKPFIQTQWNPDQTNLLQLQTK